MRFSTLFVFILLLGINSEVNANLDLLEKAEVLYNEARFAEAISVYQETIKNNPQNIEAYLNLVHLYKDLGEYKQATDLIKQAIQFFKDIRLKILLGQVYYLNSKPRQAIFQLRQLLPYYSEDSQVLLYLGLCYEDIGNLAEAEHYYLDAVRFKSDNVLAYLKLGDIYYQRQKVQEAAQAYQEVISLDPSITEVRSRLAECYAKLGEFEESYRQYAKCVAISPEDQVLQKRLEETKAKLGEDFFAQQKRLTSQLRRRKSIQVEIFPDALGAPQVRVGIAKIKGSIEFKCGSDFKIIGKQGDDSLFQGKTESVYSLIYDKNTSIQLKDYQGNVLLAGLDKPFLIKNKSKNSVISIFDIPVGTGNFWAGWHDQQYRGIIEVIPDDSGFQLINLVNLEEYLYGVLPSEMPADWSRQALCAQAIAARTWAIKNKARHNHQGFNFCSAVHCQVYKGVGAEAHRTNQAVDETAGLILVESESQSHNAVSDVQDSPDAKANAYLVSSNHPIDIFYSNNCGGCTRDGVVDTLSLDFHFPLSPLELEVWLMSQPDTFCNLKEERSANFRWVRIYKQEQLQAILDKSGIDVGQPLKIIPEKRAGSSHLISIKIKGTENSEVIEGESNIRKSLGNLRSSAFKIETKFNQENLPVEFIFYGGGFGHARGLCQTGVKGMALEGYNYLEILRHYYPDAEIKRIY